MTTETTLAHYGILGMKWGVRRTPEQLAKLRGDRAEYREKRRNVTAAQRNLEAKSLNASRAHKKLDSLESEFRQTAKKVVLSWNKTRKQQEMGLLDSAIQRAAQELEIPEARRQQALKLYKQKQKELVDFVAKMNEEYGADNVKQLKTKKVTMGERYVEEITKTGINLANFPIIGNWVSGDKISDWEMEYRNELLEKNAQAKSTQRYA